MLLAVFCGGLTACKENPPKPPNIDLCVILTEHKAHCIPFRHDGPEYIKEPEELIGGFFVSPDHYTALVLYIAELEEFFKKRDQPPNHP